MIKAFFGDEKYTTEELNARLKFFIGIILGLTLFGIVFVVLYSLIFVTQPMNGMSPVDNKFFELIIPVATFLTGTLSGIMLAGDDRDLRAKAIDAAGKSAPPSAPIAPTTFPTKPFMPMASSLPQMPPSGSSNIAGSVAPPVPPAPMPMNFTPEVVAGFNGKPAPVQPPQPEI